MPTNEKEYNGNLFDQISLLEDIRQVAEKEGAKETVALIDRKVAQVERKLYQSPPLVKKSTTE